MGENAQSRFIAQKILELREEGVALVRRYDGELPIRQFQWFLDYIGITEDYFWEVCNYYRSMSNAWEKREDVWSLKAVVS